MEYKEYINARMEGMYSIIESSDSIALEAFKKGKMEDIKRAMNSLLNFLRKKDPKQAEEIEKNPSKIKTFIEKKNEQWKEWASKHPALAIILTGNVGYYNGNNAFLNQYIAMQQHAQAVNLHAQAMGMGMMM